jgi:DNA-binding GntR family transcriptional regulator
MEMTSRLSDPPAPAAAARLHRTLPTQIADALAMDIIQERYAPGERLNEVHIAAQWGVSRSPLREALRLLEQRGLVVITPQRGARVTTLSLEEVEQLFEIRAVLVGLAARRAAARQDGETARRLDALLVALEASITTAERYQQASAATAIEIAAMGGSEPLRDMIVSFAHRIGRYARLGLSSRARRMQSIANWRALVQAIQLGDADGAEALLRRLALDNRDEAMRVLRKRKAAPS